MLEKPKMTVQITIGICVRNCEKDVERIVKNVSGQDFLHKNIEVIFVDDGSEDNTVSLISQMLPSLDITSKLFHHKWKGLGYSRNVVLKNAKGDYIVWVDDGILLSKDYIQKNTRFLEKNSNVGIVKGIIDVYSGSNHIRTLENMASLVFFRKYAGKFTTKLPGIGGSIYRVKSARQVGGFDEQIRGANEDTDIAYRIKSAGWKIYISQTNFSLIHNEKLNKVWIKNYWYGYGAHFNLHKHRELRTILYKSTPLAGFLQGILIFNTAYKLTHKKIAFLLPFFITIRRIAFCLGFIKSHSDSYGH